MEQRLVLRVDGHGAGREAKTNLQGFRRHYAIAPLDHCFQPVCVHVNFQHDLLQKDQRRDQHLQWYPHQPRIHDCLDHHCCHSDSLRTTLWKIRFSAH